MLLYHIKLTRLNTFYLLFCRELLDRALVKRLRDSDSDSEKEEESSSSQSNSSSAAKPTDILTTDQHTEAQVCAVSLNTVSSCKTFMCLLC